MNLHRATTTSTYTQLHNSCDIYTPLPTRSAKQVGMNVASYSIWDALSSLLAWFKGWFRLGLFKVPSKGALDSMNLGPVDSGDNALMVPDIPVPFSAILISL